MIAIYPVIFTETDDNILIEVPDLKIFTEANGADEPKGTIKDALHMAKDAIGLNCITKEDMGIPLPTPTHIKNIDVKNSEFSNEGDSFASLVDVDLSEYRRKIDNRTVRKNLTIPHWLNYEAEKQGVNFSEVLKNALMDKLQIFK